MIIKNLLGGNSGCVISLIIDEKKQTFVRKKTTDTQYNQRLETQYIKQKEFKHENNKFLSAKIIDFNKNKEGCVYFDMEYIRSVSCCQYLINASTLKLEAIIKELIEISAAKPLILNKYTKEEEINQIFQEKINQVKEWCCKNNIQQNFKSINQIFKILENYNFKQVEESYCHGDLTLSNILISEQDDKIYLIDFLDSFFDTWMIDIAKIFQDLICKWSYREKILDKNQELRLIIASKILQNEIIQMPEGKIKLDCIYHILLLNLIRIIPYAKDNKTIIFLEKQTNNVFNIIENL